MEQMSYKRKPRPNIFTTNSMSEITFIEEVLWKGGLAFTEHLLNSTTMKKFLENDYNFDLVICEDFIQEAFYMLSHKYQAPLIVVTPYGNSMKQLFMVGNPLQLSTVLYEFVAIEDPTSFAGRLKNLYVSAYEFIFWRYRYLDKQEQLVKKYIKNLPQPVPSLYDIQKNASLFLINSHFSFDVPVAYQPNIIEVGGLHVAHSDDVLPQDLKRILSESKHGVIYVNFGSNVKSSELPGDKKRALLNTFNKLQHTVLWKWEEDYMEDKPNNVIIRKWFPQSAVLAHPNVKLFITHGGLMSTQEAIYHGVPLVGVPIFADQFNNILLAEQAGFGRVLQYEQLNDKNVDRVINEVLRNESYKQRAIEVSYRFKDRPMTPLNLAIYWIEYVLRNNGAEFMKSPGLRMSWLAYYMIDIYILTFVMMSVILWILIKGFKLLFYKELNKKRCNTKQKIS
ncbi:UDP-glycosyltransferase UGT5-like [Leptidea sinapis]|uniref:UDP-glycosyltransferase UGT5-like n=1 Tax=Leptidea sinapis TaxID=189913 RepID=UPI0021C418EB|nr:UDP-glycosyltransferase UGT5-like [Leptidea sinapis]